MTQLTVIGLIGSILMAVMVIIVRTRGTKKPTSLKKIILPPIFMSTGFSMFLYSPMRVTMLHAVESLIVGMILSIPLILTSKFEINGRDIFLKRSKSFVFILLGLLILRSIMKVFIGDYITFYESGALFYILAVGMIFPWRIAMLVKYKELKKRLLKQPGH